MQANHPISLERVLFTRSSVISLPEHNPSARHATQHQPVNSITIDSIAETPGRYLATMSMVLNAEGDPTDPYMIDMECIGVFTADDTLSEEDRQRGLMITAHSVLYGAIREAVAWLTSRQAYGALSLGLSILSSKPIPPSS